MRDLTPAVAIIAGAWLLVGCEDMCGNDVVVALSAPGGGHKAVLFQRDCGATTGFSTQLSVLDADDELEGSGNAFVADRGGDPAPWGGPWVEIVWLSSDHLLVRHDAAARTFEQDDSVEGVQISYQPVRR